jgi:hypothetical protein
MIVCGMQGLTWTNATTIPVAKPGTGTLGTRTVIGLSRGFALYNQSLPSKTRLVIPAETGPIFSDDHVSSAELQQRRLLRLFSLLRLLPSLKVHALIPFG